MIYALQITTPANTPAAAPKTTPLPITAGIIHQVDLEFPAGGQFLHRVKITYQGAHIFPSNGDGYLTADNNLIRFREYVDVNDFPHQLDIVSWNLDDTNDHDVVVRVGVLRKEILAPWLLSWRERLAGRKLGL